MSLARHTSLLEKWLEDMPNSNSSVNVKKERKELKDIFAVSAAATTAVPGLTIPGLSVAAVAPAAVPGVAGSGLVGAAIGPIPGVSIRQEPASSLAANDLTTSHSSNDDKKPAVEPEDKANAIDSSSIKGIFGWDTVQDIPVPVILRDEGKLVAVRIVESKVISRFSNYLPWNVFSCINIKSYYVTENEARLLNDININHCEYQFGYDPFTTKDVVVGLSDVFTLYKFLETAKDIFTFGLAKCGIEWLGFVNISRSHVVPFISKTCPRDSVARKYVPQSLVQQSVLLVKVDKCDMNEWDASYMRMLCVYAGLEHLHIQSNDNLCLLDDLKWDSSLCPLHIEECSPPISKVSNPKLSLTKDNLPFSSATIPTRSSAIDDQNWLIASQGTSSSALRSLHQISRAEINGVSLRAINLKPYSNQQAVFVSDVVTKMFRGVSILTAHYILEKILQVKLYECTRLHEDAFIRSGVRPLQGDKLVAVEVLKKCLPQLRQIILAGMPLTGHSSI